MEEVKVEKTQVELSNNQIFLLNLVSQGVIDAQSSGQATKEIPLIDGNKLVVNFKKVRVEKNDEEKKKKES